MTKNLEKIVELISLSNSLSCMLRTNFKILVRRK